MSMEFYQPSSNSFYAIYHGYRIWLSDLLEHVDGQLAHLDHVEFFYRGRHDFPFRLFPKAGYRLLSKFGMKIELDS